MSTLDNASDVPTLGTQQPVAHLPRLRWTHILSISIFNFGFSFHWAALGVIILPSQVFKIVGNLHAGGALAFVLIPGAFVALVTNPLFGFFSDRTRGKLAAWGSRRPYILFGTLINVACLVWMASARDIASLAIAYALVQFSSNAAQAPFHALLPDIVPAEQRGLTSGVMGLLQVGGNIGGVILAGMFIDAKQSWPIYQAHLWLAYGIMMGVLIVFMLITIFAVRERSGILAQRRALESAEQARRRFSIPPRVILTCALTLLAVGVAWGLISLWNVVGGAHLRISSDVEQVVLEVIATIGILILFDFRPRRNPDFAWVVGTRLLMLLGIYTVQTFLQYYMRDAVGAAHPEQQTTNFVILVSLTSLASTLGAGWLSDRFGRKRMVYIAGALMGMVGLIFIITHSLTIVLASAALFGLGYGAYLSVDWALIVDVLPSEHNFARDMGIWNIAVSLAQVIAPILGGPLIDTFTQRGQPVLGFQLLFTLAIVYCVLGTVTIRFIKSVKK
jgi:MFS family permease